MLKKLIINADDFGHTMGVSYGIIEAFQKGVVTSTTALVVSDCFSRSMDVANAIAPDLPIGLHLTLTLNQAKPILPKAVVPSLSDENGFFWKQQLFVQKVKPEEVYLEWEAQILTFLKSGRRPTHLDAHHNAYGKSEALFHVLVALAKKYQFPIRNPSRPDTPEALLSLSQDAGVKMPDLILPQFYDEGVTFENFTAMLDVILQNDGEFFEINVHPAFLEAKVMTLSSYNQKRLVELELLTSEKFKEALVSRNILLCSYSVFN